MKPTVSFSNRYRRWWLGGEESNVQVFLVEEFAEIQKGLHLIMGIGAILFLVRGLLEIWANMGPNWEQETAFRVGGAAFFGTLYFLYGRTHNSAKRAAIFCIYLFVYIGATVIWAPQHGMHIAYLAVPIVLCIAFGVLMWPRIDGLYWPIAAVITPAVTMLIMNHATHRDWAAYIFYFMVSIVFAFAVRRTRLRTAFALFVFRENLRNKADRDPLTGLLNRAGWREQAAGVCDTARISGLPASIVFFDIDHFKKVNDEHGHAAGDRVLIHASRVMEGALRPGDVLARLGGEEFVAALLGVSTEQATEIANRVRQQIKEARGPVPITISAGVAELSDTVDLAQAMHQADLGLLEAKRSGRNRVCIAKPDKAATDNGPQLSTSTSY